MSTNSLTKQSYIGIMKKSVKGDERKRKEHHMELMREPLVNTSLLDLYIEKSGYKTNYICDKIGISRQAFHEKKKGRYAFRTSEIYVLCDLLKIPDDDKKKIFLP